MQITYIGHATLLIEIAGRRILTDPNFDPALARFLPRVSPPGIPLAELPLLDAILLTHAHADHLSFDTLRRLPGDVPLWAPPAVARWVERSARRPTHPLAPGERADVGGVGVHAAAATHVGARWGVDRWRAAANMYLVDAPGGPSCFFAGDTALTPDSHRLVADRLAAQGRRLDVALLPIGHPPPWKRRSFRRGHLTPEDALALFERLDARYLIPYHWGTFEHVTSSAHDAIHHFRPLAAAHARGADVRILEPGESFTLPAD